MADVGNLFQIGLDCFQPGDAFRGEPIIGGDAEDRKLVGSPLTARLIVSGDTFTFLFDEGVRVGVDVEMPEADGTDENDSRKKEK